MSCVSCSTDKADANAQLGNNPDSDQKVTPIVVGIIIGTVLAFTLVVFTLFYCKKMENKRIIDQRAAEEMDMELGIPRGVGKSDVDSGRCSSTTMVGVDPRVDRCRDAGSGIGGSSWSIFGWRSKQANGRGEFLAGNFTLVFADPEADWSCFLQVLQTPLQLASKRCSRQMNDTLVIGQVLLMAIRLTTFGTTVVKPWLTPERINTLFWIMDTVISMYYMKFCSSSCRSGVPLVFGRMRWLSLGLCEEISHSHYGIIAWIPISLPRYTYYHTHFILPG